LKISFPAQKDGMRPESFDVSKGSSELFVLSRGGDPKKLGWVRLSPEEAKVKHAEAIANSDIAMLSTAIANAKDTFQIPYVPSRIRSSETGNYDMEQPLDREPVNFLKKWRPRMKLDGIDWNGNGKIDPPDQGGDVILEGDQCLVFFLGGINGTKGFSTNPANPAADTKERMGPFLTSPPNASSRTETTPAKWAACHSRIPIARISTPTFQQ
jgi:hypothetical protein